MQRNPRRSRIAQVLLASLLSVFGIAQHAEAAVIHGAVSAVINSGGPGFGSINDTLNQNGLFTSYVNDVTDFDTYVATATHTDIFSGYEWFSNLPSDNASVTYDLGDNMGFDRVALWNEEASGIGFLDLFGSTDNITYVSLASGLLPTNNTGSGYMADVFSVAGAGMRYIRFDMSKCPQTPSGFDSCAIGEVAFRRPGDSDVPEPVTLGLFGIGLAGLAAVRRRKQH